MQVVCASVCLEEERSWGHLHFGEIGAFFLMSNLGQKESTYMVLLLFIPLPWLLLSFGSQ